MAIGFFPWGFRMCPCPENMYRTCPGHFQLRWGVGTRFSTWFYAMHSFDGRNWHWMQQVTTHCLPAFQEIIVWQVIKDIEDAFMEGNLLPPSCSYFCFESTEILWFQHPWKWQKCFWWSGQMRHCLAPGSLFMMKIFLDQWQELFCLIVSNNWMKVLVKQIQKMMSY